MKEYEVLIMIDGIFEVIAENQNDAINKAIAAGYEEQLRREDADYEIIGVKEVK